MLSSLSCLSLLFLAMISGSSVKCRKMQAEMDRVLGTPEESLLLVGKLLGSVNLGKCFKASKDQMDWYYGMFVKAGRVEVAQRILEQLMGKHEPFFEAGVLAEAVERRVKTSGHRIDPGSPDHEIVNYCLTRLKGHATVGQFEDIMSRLIKDGNLPVLKDFVSAGFTLPRAVETFYEIEDEPVRMAQYLFAHGYRAENSRRLLAGLFQSTDFRGEDLIGLLTERNMRSGVCLQVAMEAGRLDLATITYESGIRLPFHFSLYTPDEIEGFFRLPPALLAEHIVNQRVMKRISGSMARAGDPKSELFGVSRAVIMRNIEAEFRAESVQSVLGDFFEVGSPRKL